MLSSPTVFSARRTLHHILSMPVAHARARVPRLAAVPEFRQRTGSWLIRSSLVALLAAGAALGQPAPSVPPAPAAAAPTTVSPVGAPAPVVADSDTVTLNFVNADIDAVVKAVAEITGRNFILDPRVKGTINIVSARPVPNWSVRKTPVCRDVFGCPFAR